MCYPKSHNRCICDILSRTTSVLVLSEVVQQVYLCYPKSYNKLKHEEVLFHEDNSDEDDSVNSPDTSSTSMTCNNHEPLTALFNTNTGIGRTNDFSSILNNSLYFD